MKTTKTHQIPVRNFKYYSALFGNSYNTIIFSILLDEHLSLMYKGESTDIKIAKNTISEYAIIDNRTTLKSLRKLISMKVLSYDKQVAIINFDYFTSVLYLYERSSDDVRERIVKLFRAGDVDGLVKLGAKSEKVSVVSEDPCSHIESNNSSEISLDGEVIKLESGKKYIINVS